MNSLFKVAVTKSVRNLSTETGLNQIQLIGRLGKDPKVSINQSTKNVSDTFKKIVFPLATNSYKGRNEEGLAIYNTDWHRIVVNDQRIVNFIEKAKICKGDRIYVNGELNYYKASGTDGNQTFVPFISAKEILRLSYHKHDDNEDDAQVIVNQNSEENELEKKESI